MREKEEGRTGSPALAYRDRLGLQREEEGGTLGDPLQPARRWVQKERRSKAKASGAAWKSKAAGGGEREDGRVPVRRSDMAEKRRASPSTVLSLKAHAFSVEALIGAEKQQQQRQSQQQPPPQKRRKLAGANGEETPSEGSGGGHGSSCDADSREGAGQSAASPSGAETCSAAPEAAKNCGGREVAPGKFLRPLAYTTRSPLKKDPPQIFLAWS